MLRISVRLWLYLFQICKLLLFQNHKMGLPLRKGKQALLKMCAILLLSSYIFSASCSTSQHDYYTVYRDHIEDEEVANDRKQEDPTDFDRPYGVQDEDNEEYLHPEEDDYDADNLDFPADSVGDMDGEDDAELCLSPQCILASANILSTMNVSADPCNNFYNYVCGKFSESHEPYEDQIRTMSFEMRRRQNAFLMHRMLLKMSYDNDLKSFDTLKAGYESCMNDKSKAHDGVTAVRKLINNYGPWPLDGALWNNKTWKFKSSINNVVTNLPVTALFSLFVSLDERNPNNYAFKLSQNGLYLPRNYYISKNARETKVRRSYLDMMVRVMEVLGYRSSNLKATMENVLQFEMKLANIYIKSSLLRKSEKMYKKMTLEELHGMNPEIEWKSLIHDWLNLAKVDYKVRNVIVFGEKYFQDLSKLIASTDKETLASYVMWRIVSKLKAFAGKKIRDIDYNFDKVFSGRSASPPRWLTCVTTIQQWMPFAYGRLYVNNHFKSKYAKEEVSEIIEDIKQAFIGNLKNVAWMDQKTRIKAKSKALAVIKLVGYPGYILDNEKLDAKYHGLSFKSTDFLGNYFKINLFSMQKMLQRLKQKRNRNEWTTTPAAVNAFYSPINNRIVFPAGILQPLFYHHEYPPSLKYGGIGTVIGHELTHAFDDHGRKFDKTGRLVQWWESSAISNFKNVADCIRKQYSKYEIYGRHMNGNLSCGENMADNGGVKLAYNAFKAYMKKNPYKKRLPGLQHLNNDQLFYIAFAKIWCIIEKRASVIKRIFTDPHSYPAFRVRGSLSNSAEFSRAFQCKTGSPMNPLNKCTLW